MTRFRVDRNPRVDSVPAGTRSMIFIGLNRAMARSIYDVAEPGKNKRLEQDASLGVTLAEWRNGTYQIIAAKGFEEQK